MQSIAVVSVLVLGSTWGASPTVASAHEDPRSALPAPEAPAYPQARRGDVVDTFHGVRVSDPYRWMEDLGSPELDAWIEAQNRLSGARLDDAARFSAIRMRLAALANLFPNREPDREAGGRAFFRELSDGKLRLYVREQEARAARVLLDPETLGQGLVLKEYVPSPDGSRLAYLVGAAGTDWGELRLREVTSGRDLPEVLENVRFQGPFD